MSEDRLIDVNKVLSKKAKGKKVPGFLVGLIKRFIHQDFLNSIIAKSGDGVDFCTDTIRELNVQLTVRGLENVPDDGTLYTFASNHPLGGVDGVALASISDVHKASCSAVCTCQRTGQPVKKSSSDD